MCYFSSKTYTMLYYHITKNLLGALMLCAGIMACNNEASTTDAGQDAAKTKTETAAPNNTNACALLTAADAEAVLSHAVTQSMSTGSMCQYMTTAEELAHTGESVTLNLMTGGASEFDAYTKSSAEQLKVTTTPVSGIGDKAAWAEGTLIIASNNNLLTVMIGKRMDKEAHLAATKDLAQKILSRVK